MATRSANRTLNRAKVRHTMAKKRNSSISSSWREIRRVTHREGRRGTSPLEATVDEGDVRARDPARIGRTGVAERVNRGNGGIIRNVGEGRPISPLDGADNTRIVRPIEKAAPTNGERVNEYEGERTPTARRRGAPIRGGVNKTTGVIARHPETHIRDRRLPGQGEDEAIMATAVHRRMPLKIGRRPTKMGHSTAVRPRTPPGMST